MYLMALHDLMIAYGVNSQISIEPPMSCDMICMYLMALDEIIS
jgi:hypothetical protein